MIDSLISQNPGLADIIEKSRDPPQAYLVGELHTEKEHLDFVRMMTKAVRPNSLFWEGQSHVQAPGQFTPTLAGYLQLFRIEKAEVVRRMQVQSLHEPRPPPASRRYFENPALILNTEFYKVPFKAFRLFRNAVIDMIPETVLRLEENLHYHLGVEDENSITRSRQAFALQDICSRLGITMFPFTDRGYRDEINERLKQGTLTESQLNRLTRATSRTMMQLLSIYFEMHPEDTVIAYAGESHMERLAQGLRADRTPYSRLTLRPQREGVEKRAQDYVHNIISPHGLPAFQG